MTLVELLVVLAIIAMLGAIAVPSAFKMLGSSRTDVDKAATEIHSLLQTARIHAMSHHAKAAVVFRLPVRNDVSAPEPTFFASAGLVAWNDKVGAYAPVGDSGVTGFRLFPETVFIPRTLPDGSSPGLQSISVCYQPDDSDADVRRLSIRPMTPAAFQEAKTSKLLPSNANEDEAFAPLSAYVFEPSGALVVENSNPKERYKLLVRSVVDPATNAQDQQAAEDNADRQYIELYRSTGRVKVVSE